MDIRFYVPSDEKVPTQLRLMVNDKQVTYWRLDDQLGYDFRFIDVSDDEALAEAAEIAKIMEWQSYDHGSQWRVTSIELVKQNERYRIGPIVRVLFRVRDAG